MSVSRVRMGCQRGPCRLTCTRTELVDPHLQRLFRGLHTSRPIAVYSTRSHLKPRTTFQLPRYHSTAAAARLAPPTHSTSTSASTTEPAVLPSTAAEWCAIRSGHTAESLTAVTITGAAASSWLQGLITADMAAIDKQQYGYTAALNFKGRVVFTALVVKPDSVQPVRTYHLLLPSTVAEAAVTHLGKLNFRRKVSIRHTTSHPPPCPARLLRHCRNRVLSAAIPCSQLP